MMTASEVTAVKLEPLRSILLVLLLPFFLRIFVISGCHNSTSEHSPAEPLTSCNTPCAAIRRQKHQADFFAQSLTFFPHRLTYSKVKQLRAGLLRYSYTFPEYFPNWKLYILQAPTSTANLLGVHLSVRCTSIFIGKDLTIFVCHNKYAYPQ